MWTQKEKSQLLLEKWFLWCFGRWAEKLTKNKHNLELLSKEEYENSFKMVKFIVLLYI